jgi:hypothetical protein
MPPHSHGVGMLLAISIKTDTLFFFSKLILRAKIPPKENYSGVGDGQSACYYPFIFK